MNQIPYKEQQYHPIRWIEKMSGYMSDPGKLILEYEDKNPNQPDFSKPFWSMISEVDSPFSCKENGPDSNKDYWAEYLDEIYSSVSGFFRTGQNLFQIRPELCEMLEETDVSNVKIKDIKLPFDAFYLYFGNAGPALWDNFRLDGVYVWDISAEKDEPIIGFTFIGSKFPNIYPPNTDSTIVFEHETHFFTALESEIGDRTVEDNSYGKYKDLTDPRDLTDEIKLLWQPYLNDIFSLVINSLLFISSRSEDVNETYSKQAPQSLVKKVQQAEKRNDKKTAERTESKISSQGFKKVKMVGSKVAESVSLSGSGHSKRSHWRRGHWRRQPFGKNLAETKLIWIEPTLVAADDEEQPEIKHLYDVEK